jgi:hypothetical protein
MFYKIVDIKFIEKYFSNIIDEINDNKSNFYCIDTNFIFKNKQKMLSRPYIKEYCPNIFRLYKNKDLINKLSDIVGNKLMICNSNMIRSCEVIISDSVDCHIHNHKDYNVYNNKRFTFLIILQSDNEQILCINNNDYYKYRKNFSIIFDDNTYHKVSKPMKNGTRIALSFSYIINDDINYHKYLLRLPQTILYNYYSCLNFNDYILKIIIMFRYIIYLIICLIIIYVYKNKILYKNN